MLRPNGAGSSKPSDSIRNSRTSAGDRKLGHLKNRNHRRQSGLQVGARGTEYLDADGWPKITRETANLHRDRQAVMRTVEMPAEAASLEATQKSAVWED